jgi:hypothetical protein
MPDAVDFVSVTSTDGFSTLAPETAMLFAVRGAAVGKD